ncbi:GMC family oxidoreductase N-terminal domain-containing protein [soil metagenome]
MAFDAASFDYIIVGAGSAGCVLAARLSEDPANRVLLLEAGPPDDAVDIRMPAKMVALFRSAFDWNFLTEPQPSAAARQVTWPLGKTLGGSSSTNAMIYIQGSPADFDGWRDEYGCTGWGYSDLLSYFDRVHRQLGVTRLRYKDRLTRAWVNAATRLGLRDVGDFAGVTEDGVGYFSVNQRGGRRWSTADAYLRPALSRPNLTVRTGALASRVVISGERATGVTYQWQGREVTDEASREVILSAGAVNSPHLLLLSGVGPEQQLARHGVPLVLDVPSVGAGLQDHPRATAVWRMTGAPRRNWLAGIRWRLFGRGPYASNGGEVGTFIRTREGLDAPDIEFMTCPPSILDQGAPPSVAVLVVGIEVHSRGSITLRSADPAEPPAIDPGYLTDPRDLEALARGVEFARSVAAQTPFAPLVAEETMPGAAVPDGAELRDWVRENVVTMHHPTSSCAMGGSPSAVCDPSLRVRGIAGLRVVDASVMPTVPRGNTNAPTIAIAERASELILQQKASS